MKLQEILEQAVRDEDVADIFLVPEIGRAHV